MWRQITLLSFRRRAPLPFQLGGGIQPLLNQCMSEIIFVVEEAPEGGYTARAVGESVFTEADDMAQLHAKIRDAVRCHFEEQ